MRNFHLVISFMVLLVGLIAPWVEVKVNGSYIRPYILASLVVFGVYPLYDWLLVTPAIYVNSLVWVSNSL
jgi:hypothetical protein